MLRRVTNLVDLVFLLHYRNLILLAQHDFHPFPPSVESSAFGLFRWFVNMGNFVIFGVFEQALSKDGVFIMDTNLVDLVFLLQEKHLILLAQHDWQPFPPSM